PFLNLRLLQPIDPGVGGLQRVRIGIDRIAERRQEYLPELDPEILQEAGVRPDLLARSVQRLLVCAGDIYADLEHGVHARLNLLRFGELVDRLPELRGEDLVRAGEVDVQADVPECLDLRGRDTVDQPLERLARVDVADDRRVLGDPRKASGVG